MTKEVMNAREVGEYLGIAESTVYKKVEYREIPFVKVGTLLRFPKWIIDQWLTERVTRPKSTLYDEFVRLSQRYHLERFLEARGLDVTGLAEQQLVAELQRAIAELKEEHE